MLVRLNPSRESHYVIVGDIGQGQSDLGFLPSRSNGSLHESSKSLCKDFLTLDDAVRIIRRILRVADLDRRVGRFHDMPLKVAPSDDGRISLCVPSHCLHCDYASLLRGYWDLVVSYASGNLQQRTFLRLQGRPQVLSLLSDIGTAVGARLARGMTQKRGNLRWRAFSAKGEATDARR